MTSTRAIGCALTLLASLAFAGGPAKTAPKATDATFVTSDGITLHYQTQNLGCEKCQAIVLVPGWTMPAFIWAKQQAELGAGAYTVIALDPRSQGESDKTPEGNYPGRHAIDLKELIEKLALKKPVLVGWSNAVLTLAAYADRYGSDGVGGFVLVDGFVWDSGVEKVAGSLLPWMLAMQQDRQKFTVDFVRSMFARPIEPEFFEALTAASLKEPTADAVAMQTASLGTPSWKAALEKMSCPVAFVYEPQLEASATLLKQLVPKAHLERIDGAGHALMVDDAEHFNRTLKAFAAWVASGKPMPEQPKATK